jgi:hypothetical protein
MCSLPFTLPGSAIMDDAAGRLAGLGAELRRAMLEADSDTVERIDDERRVLLASVSRPTPELRATLAEEMAADVRAMAALRAAMSELARARKARRGYGEGGPA